MASTRFWQGLRLAVLALMAAALLNACGGGGAGDSLTATQTSRIAGLESAGEQPAVVTISKVSETRVGRAVFDYVFRITVRNGSQAVGGLQVDLAQVGTGTTVLDGVVLLGAVGAGQIVTSNTDTITLRHDRRYPFDATALVWRMVPKVDLASASANLGPLGGSVALTAPDGTRFALDVPAGALTRATTVELAARAAPAGGRFQLVLQPAGLVLKLPAKLVIQLPAGASLPVAGGLVLAGRPIPFERRADGALLLQVGHFARPGGASAAGGATDRKRALAATAEPCAGPPGLEASMASGSLTDQDSIETEIYAQCMKGAVQDAATNMNLGFDKAIRMALATAAYLQRVGGLGEADPHIAEASRLACTAFAFELDAVRGTEVTTVKSVYRVVQPLLFWARTEQQLGVHCADTEGWQAVVGRKVQDALDWYAGEAVDLNQLTSPAYTRAMNEARDGVEAIAEVKAVRPAGALASVLSSQLEDRALAKRTEGLIAAPWQRCRADSRYDALASLADTVGVIPAIQRAAQYCGSAVEVQSRLASGTVEQALEAPLGGQAAASERIADTVNASPDGSLQLAGTLARLGCPRSWAGGDEALVLKLGSTEVRRVNAGPYLREPLTLDIADALRRANLDPQTTAEATLSVEREGDPCQGFWGAAPQPLLEIKINLGGCKPPTGQAVCITPVTAGWFEDGMLNAQGKVLFWRGGRAWIWAAGQVTALPGQFTFPPWLLDSGAVVSNATTTTSLGIQGFLPAAFDDAGFRYTAEPQKFPNALDRSSSYTLIHGAYQNRVWGVRLEVNPSAADLGGCELGYRFQGPPELRWDCRRTVVVSSADGSGNLQPLRPLVVWPQMVGATSPRFLSMNAQGHLVGNGSLRYGGSQESWTYGALLATASGLSFLAPSPGLEVAPQFIDDAGIVYSAIGRYSSASLPPPAFASRAPAYPAPGASIGAMNAAGDVLSCDSATQPTNVVIANTATGRVLARLTAMPGSNGIAVPLAPLCRPLATHLYSPMGGGPSWPGMDRHGRVLATGVDREGRNLRVVITPRGKPLPPTATAPFIKGSSDAFHRF